MISKNAVKEWLHNLTYQALTNENDKVVMEFDEVGELVSKILEELSKIELSITDEAIETNEILNNKLNKITYDLENAPEMII